MTTQNDLDLLNAIYDETIRSDSELLRLTREMHGIASQVHDLQKRHTDLAQERRHRYDAIRAGTVKAKL